MSAILTYHLQCDAPDCSAEHTHRDRLMGRATVTSARAVAAALGWSHVLEPRPHGPARSLDYCPGCTKERS